ncbi:MAG: hypothetical protein DRQ62_04180 [Gammaproteobacteria bacterium]|nr:MAG: hypothetical protein DRQ62_04180 [Gammaproteobacteria bacterium]
MIIYEITNKITGKQYIGQTTKSLNYRWRQHCKNKYYIGSSIKKWWDKRRGIKC